MLSVQRDIAREITNNLRPTLSGVERRAPRSNTPRMLRLTSFI
jgi:hypothetical protein